MCRDYYEDMYKKSAPITVDNFIAIEIEGGGQIDALKVKIGNNMIELLNSIVEEYSEFQDLCDAVGAPKPIPRVNPYIAVGIMMEKMKNLYLKSQEIIDLM